MKKSKVQLKKDGMQAGAILLGGLGSAAIVKKVPSQFTGAGLLAVGLGGGLLLKGAAQAVCLGMIPMGAVSTVNTFLSPKVPAVSDFMPALSGIEDQLLMGHGMGYLGNAMADPVDDFESNIMDYALSGEDEDYDEMPSLM